MSMKITKEDFQAYVGVQESGLTNMWDVNQVSKLSGLDRDQIVEIMSNYGKYQKLYSEDEELGAA